MSSKHSLPLIILATLPGIAQADFVGTKLGVEYWQQDSSGGITETDTTIPDSSLSDDGKVNAWLLIEHPIPLLPNIKLSYTDYATDGNIEASFSIGDTTFSDGAYLDVDATATDLTLYYELLDLDVLSLDMGLTFRYLKADFFAKTTSSGQQADESFSAPLPMLYAAGQIGMPFTGLFAKAEINYLGYDGSNISDIRGAICYEFVDTMAIDMAVEVGYRTTLLEIDDIDDIYADLEYSGMYAGIQIHF